MVDLRRQKAQVEEYNASQRMAGMEALGKGFEGLLGGLGKGMETRQNDALANQLMNRYNPPRAQAVDPSLQGPADTLAAGMPGGPMTQGGPFTGGYKGFQMQGLLDKQALAEEKARAAQELGIAKFGSAADLAQAKIDNYSSMIGHREDITQLKEQAERDKMATAAMSQANKAFQDKVKQANAYNLGIKATLGQAAGAKTQSEWEKAVVATTGLYQAHTASGFKDVPYPQIPPSYDQRTAAATAASDASNLSPRGLTNWFGSSQADIDAAKQAAQQMPGAYQYPGPSEYEMSKPPEEGPSTNPQDYMPGGSAAPPSAQQPQGGGGGYSSPADVKAAFQAGKLNQDQARQILKSKFGFE